LLVEFCCHNDFVLAVALLSTEARFAAAGFAYCLLRFSYATATAGRCTGEHNLDSPAINWPNTIGSVLNCWRTGRLQRTLQHSFKAVQHRPVGVMMNDKKQWTGLESLVCEAACPEVQKQSEMMLNIFETTAYARIYTAPQQQPNPETAC